MTTWKITYQIFKNGWKKMKSRTATIGLGGNPTFDAKDGLRRTFNIPLFDKIEILKIEEVLNIKVN